MSRNFLLGCALMECTMLYLGIRSGIECYHTYINSDIPMAVGTGVVSTGDFLVSAFVAYTYKKFRDHFR